MAIDQNGDAVAMLNVVGKAPEQKKVPHDGKYTAFTLRLGRLQAPAGRRAW